MTTRLRPYAEFFACLRRRLRFTQKQMGRALSCGQSTIARIELGMLPPPLKALEIAYCLSKHESWVSGDPTAFYEAHGLLCRHVGGG